MIRYFIPSDGDDSEHPNVFQLPSSTISNNGTLKLGDISRNFPLPGSYHFRFKKKFRDSFVWVDITGDQSSVPSHNGIYTAKVSRISSTVPFTETVQPALSPEKPFVADFSKNIPAEADKWQKSEGDLLGISSMHTESLHIASVDNSSSNDLLSMFAPIKNGSVPAPPGLIGTVSPDRKSPQLGAQANQFGSQDSYTQNTGTGLIGTVSNNASDKRGNPISWEDQFEQFRL